MTGVQTCALPIWIKPEINEEDSRKKEYQITKLGIEIVKNEIMRLEELIITGKKIDGGVTK